MSQFAQRLNAKVWITTILLATTCIVNSFATEQISDILIYKGDTLFLSVSPLEQLYDNGLATPRFFGDKEGCRHTGCWRGFEARWTIVDDQLYLTGIFSCCFRQDSVKANLLDLFGKKCIDGRVKADWVTDTIMAFTGHKPNSAHSRYGTLYEKEIELQFKKGVLVKTTDYDNSKTRLSVYSSDEEKLRRLIHAAIDWKALPSLVDKPIKVYVQFSANEQGVVDSVKVLKGYSAAFDTEAIRVIKAIPTWDVIYRQGRLIRTSWVMPVTFSNEYRKKYER
jgi:hypothetical protein